MPEVSSYPGIPDDSLDGRAVFRSPGRAQAIVIPQPPQTRALLNRQYRTFGNITGFAPEIDMSFRPEGENRGSRVSDIVVEPSRRHGKVHDRVHGGEHSLVELERNRVAA